MNFLRRLLGLQAGNEATKGEVQITYEDESVGTQPPEPVVEPAPETPSSEEDTTKATASTSAPANAAATTPTAVPVELHGTRPLPPMETIQRRRGKG